MHFAGPITPALTRVGGVKTPKRKFSRFNLNDNFYPKITPIGPLCDDEIPGLSESPAKRQRNCAEERETYPD